MGYRYSVIWHGELIVDRSRDPECDAARVLLAMGYTGKLTMLDGKTGIPPTMIDVERRPDSASQKKALMASSFAVWARQTYHIATRMHPPSVCRSKVDAAVAAFPSADAPCQ